MSAGSVGAAASADASPSSPAWQVMLLPWRRALRRGPTIALIALLLSMLLLPSVLRAVNASRIAGVLTPVLAWVAVLVLWCNFVSGLVRQNLPTAARLVPGQVRQLRLVLLVGWLVLSLAQALVAFMAFGQGVAWGLSAALLLVAVAWVVRVPTLWAAVWLLPAFSWWWTQLALVRWASAAWLQWCAEQPLTATLATLAVAGLCLPLVMQGGGAAHRRSHARREAWGAAGKSARQPGPGVFLWPAWVRRQFSALYRVVLARLCGRPGSDVMARAMLALGPAAHWTRQFTVALTLLAIAGAVLGSLFVSGALPIQGFKRSQLLGAAIGLMSFALSLLLQVSTAMQTTRREQALLALVPGMPRGAALNHALAWRLMRPFLVAWALASAGAWWLVGGTESSGPMAQAVIWGTLPFGLVLWRDWSRMRRPNSARVGVLVLLMVISVMTLGAVTRSLGIAGEVLAAVSLVVTVGLGVWRWRVLGRAPSAWPASRASP